jgi:RNA polymerase sigma-70 factor (ECF subfamily)
MAYDPAPGWDCEVVKMLRAIRKSPADVPGTVRDRGLPVELLPDDALLAGLATGDTEIAMAFVRRFQRIVFGVALAILGDVRLAEDVAQQTFERAWRHAQVYDSRRGSVRTWLTAIARNLAVDAARVRRPTPVDPSELVHMLSMVSESAEQCAVAGESVAELRRAVATLPVTQARALVLAGIHGLTAREIADIEGIPLGTAKTRIRAAMGKLRTTLSTKVVDHG